MRAIRGRGRTPPPAGGTIHAAWSNRATAAAAARPGLEGRALGREADRGRPARRPDADLDSNLSRGHRDRDADARRGFPGAGGPRAPSRRRQDSRRRRSSDSTGPPEIRKARPGRRPRTTSSGLPGTGEGSFPSLSKVSFTDESPVGKGTSSRRPIDGIVIPRMTLLATGSILASPPRESIIPPSIPDGSRGTRSRTPQDAIAQPVHLLEQRRLDATEHGVHATTDSQGVSPCSACCSSHASTMARVAGSRLSRNAARHSIVASGSSDSPSTAASSPRLQGRSIRAIAAAAVRRLRGPWTATRRAPGPGRGRGRAPGRARRPGRRHPAPRPRGDR